MQHFTDRLSRQDNATGIRHYSTSVINEGATFGHSPALVMSVATYKYEPKKVGNVARTNRIIRGAERLERVYQAFAYSAMKQARSENQREERRAKR